MEIKEIDIEDFKANQRYRKTLQQGNLNGDYNDFLLFLKWTLESNHNDNAENLKDAIKIFSDKYKCQMTTKFLLNQMRSSFPNKTNRIRRLLDKMEMTTTTINRYFYSVIASKLKLREFGTERTYNVGHSYKRLEKEQLDLLIDKQQQKQRLAEIKKNFEELEKRKLEIEKETKKIEQPKPEIDFPAIEIKCKRCNKTIKVPLTPNMDTDKSEKLMSGIYTCFVNDVEKGVKFCAKCEEEIRQEGLWKIEAMTKWLNENKGICGEISAKEFCEEFRNDKGYVSGQTIRAKIEAIMPIEICRINGDSIKIKI
jgi:hypothetical protein